MSLINREHLNYFTAVEHYFMSFTKKGVLLSSLDYHLIKSWEEKGIPLFVVCKGIKKSLTSFIQSRRNYDSLPKSIKYCQKAIEEEYMVYCRTNGRIRLKQKSK